MPTLLLVRHGRTTANAGGILAGRTRGVRLDAVGRDQAIRAAERAAGAPISRVATSPLERCRQTSRALVERQTGTPELVIEKGITECDYGQWQGRALKDLAGEPLWKVVQTQPSAAAFPGGESLAAMQARSVEAIRRHDAEVAGRYGADAVWAAVSHGDVIKSVLADALGMHLDLFQRIVVGPASISIVRYGPHRPDVVATNTEAGDLSWLRAAAPAGDAPVGGGAGHGDPEGEDGPQPSCTAARS
ncbi:MSMEG_4193 family putative phosphomutase [Cellulosimicrobium sp. CUA-896]|uniref:MSMEG_4193 family putative phosphomutase n=1 Tax=Cellulosimicrobium sp. CUA-896 TaxID=1517881 RepID=UPI0009619B30|nr:MSMEG_4193 family putative phosphomutase [Cellulosimicrobium sp. CUA-896]OLT47798.1 histidine phosphatase [Cellulosimicrobium sp. CUA-896]